MTVIVGTSEELSAIKTHFIAPYVASKSGVPRRQPHRRSGLATLPSVGAVP